MQVNHTIEHPQQTCNCINWNAPHSFSAYYSHYIKDPARWGVQQCWEWLWIVTREVVKWEELGPSCGKSEQIFIKPYTNILENGTDSSQSSQVWSQKVCGRDYCCEFETLGCGLKAAMRSRKSQKVKVTFFFSVCLFPPDCYDCRIGKVLWMWTSYKN